MLTITPEEQEQIKEIKRNKTPQVFDLSDLGNAARFEYRHGGNFLWTQATHWLTYKNGLWVEDKTAKVDQATLLIMCGIALSAVGKSGTPQNSAEKEGSRPAG